jgi:hypothetical protein
MTVKRVHSVEGSAFYGMQKSHSRSPHRAVKRFGFYPVGYTKPFVK